MILVLIAAQLCIAFAPLGEGRFGPDARPHVEAGGTTAHHAHDASHCAACVARGLLWGSDVTPRALVDALRATIVAHSIRDSRGALLVELEDCRTLELILCPVDAMLDLRLAAVAPATAL